MSATTQLVSACKIAEFRARSAREHAYSAYELIKAADTPGMLAAHLPESPTGRQQALTHVELIVLTATLIHSRVRSEYSWTAQAFGRSTFGRSTFGRSGRNPSVATLRKHHSTLVSIRSYTSAVVLAIQQSRDQIDRYLLGYEIRANAHRHLCIAIVELKEVASSLACAVLSASFSTAIE